MMKHGLEAGDVDGGLLGLDCGAAEAEPGGPDEGLGGTGLPLVGASGLAKVLRGCRFLRVC